MGLILPRSFVTRQERADERRRREIAKELAQRLTLAIQAVYPEHLFTVQVDTDNGNIFIDHPLLSHAKARYFVPHFSPEPEKAAVKLAGEILERVNVRRGELKNYEQYDEAEPLARTQFNSR